MPLPAAFKQEQKEKKESQAVRKRKKGSDANVSSPQKHQPLAQSEPTVNFTQQATTSAESANSSQGEEDGGMEVDPLISVEQTTHSQAQLSVNISN